MTDSFKVGDKVEFLTDYPENRDYQRVNKGDTGTIKVAVGYDELVTVTLDKNGNTERVYARRLKLVDNGFKKGAKVFYDSGDHNPEFDGLELEVVDKFGETGSWVIVTKGNHDARWTVGKKLTLTTKYLSLIPAEEPKPFTFKDIQKGDKIRRTHTYTSGATEVREGIAAYPAQGGYWSDGKTFILAYDSDDTPKSKSTVTLELLERPEPVKEPEPWETAKAGDVLFRLYKTGEKDTFVKLADGGWTIHYPAGGTWDIGPGEKVAGYFLGHGCVAPQLA